MHISIPVEATIELLNLVPVNPLISKCQIKVCYVGDDPNRNRSIITKDVAREMAKTLPGSPIVGFFNEAKQDFEEHNRVIDISNGRFEIKDVTRPYGFIDLNAKVWFQKFLDDGIEHEYLVTEGYIWTDVYPEAKRITDKGNNHSMELHETLTKGTWSSDDNGYPEFFIINEAIIQKLCILGEDVEPCFEGSRIAAHFSFDRDFKKTMFSMMKELQLALQEGGNTQMSDEIKTPLTEEEELQNPVPEEETEFKKKPDEEEEEQKDTSDDSSDDDDKEDDDDDDKKKKGKNFASEQDEKEEEKCPDCHKPKSECECKKYNLNDIPEYVELEQKYSALMTDYNALNNEIQSLREFKAASDKKDKQAMIDRFYMLSDEDKAEVVANIDNYSLDDIEAKLSIICVRNKVSFSLDDDNTDKPEKSNPLVYHLNDNDNAGDNAPAWIKAVRDTAKNMI